VNLFEIRNSGSSLNDKKGFVFGKPVDIDLVIRDDVAIFTRRAEFYETEGIRAS
jgi:hypothetical protein